MKSNQIPGYVNLRRILNPILNLNRTKKVKNKENSKKSSSDSKKNCLNQNPSDKILINLLSNQLNKPDLLKTSQIDNENKESFYPNEIDETNKECIICLSSLPKEKFTYKLICEHFTCDECLKRYLKTEISESRINIACPECTISIHPNLIEKLLKNDDFLYKYETFMLRRSLITDPNVRWCPGLDCNYAVIANNCSKCPILNCERKECGIQFCYYCKQVWHPNKLCNGSKLSIFSFLTKNKKLDKLKISKTNDKNTDNKTEKKYLESDFSKNFILSKSSSLDKLSKETIPLSTMIDNNLYLKNSSKSQEIIQDFDLPSSSQLKIMKIKIINNDNDISNNTAPSSSKSSSSFENLQQNTIIDIKDANMNQADMKPCPSCKILIYKIKDGSCNQMICSVCGTEFCWLCLKKTSDLHYFIPSGCTFWGKKPWSKKKKIFWQISLLIGAPIGIILIAGIAVPAILVGIPVWFGQKLKLSLHKKPYSKKTKSLLIGCGVLTSILVSPIMAAGAVAIGVPSLLAYVYGIVPISLCIDQICTMRATSNEYKLDQGNNIQKKKNCSRTEKSFNPRILNFNLSD